jgi:Tol biopolymer transport system component
MRRRLPLATALALIVGACDGSPTAPGNAPPSFAISDGANAGNPNFFWAPPLAASASSHDNWDAGGFNPDLLVNVDVCELDRNPVDFPPDHPTTPAGCVAGPARVHFAPTEIAVSTDAEQYSVSWKTDGLESAASGFYRLYVYVGTPAAPGPTLGFIDLDPVDKGMKNLRTGEVVAFQEGRTIPVKFRIERGVLCPPGEECTEKTITKGAPGEIEIAQYTETVNGVAVPLAGVAVPTEAFPEGVDQLTFRFRKVQTTSGSGLRQIAAQDAVLCHPNLPLQQFDGCFEITTVPELPTIGESSNQFAAPITVAVCFELHDSGDPREPFVQLWATDDGESRPLPSASDAGILTEHEGKDCGDAFAAAESANALVRLASAGLRTLARGFGSVFGVKPAYAIDRGLGGLTLALSTISPVLTAEVESTSDEDIVLDAGLATNATVRILGTTSHDADALLDEGIPTIPVTFTLAPGNGRLFVPNNDEIEGTVLTVQTNAADEETDPGFASIGWDPPLTPGLYTLTATGPALGGPITFRLTVEGSETPPGSDTWIVFATDRSGGVDLYRMRPDGSQLTNLTNTATAREFNPDLSSDGSRIVFVDGGTGDDEIHAMNADGSGRTTLTSSPGRSVTPTWSPDGSRIAFASDRDGGWDIFVMNADGTDQSNLIDDGAFDFSPHWSPDGTKLAFTSDRAPGGGHDIYVLNTDNSGGLTNLTNAAGNDQWPRWSPDGSKILFVSDRSEAYDVYVMNADGSNVVRLTNTSAFEGEPDWSPDGTRIVFTSQRDGGAREIYVMNADGTAPTRITNHPSVDIDPTWGPAPPAPPPTGVLIDGSVGAGEWDDASAYGPFIVNLPTGTTTATLRVKNTSTQLFMALQFGHDLISHNIVTATLVMDENADNENNVGEDGFVVQQRVGGQREDEFFDLFFSCSVEPCQLQSDAPSGGSNDGATASTDGETPTFIEIAKGINTRDPLDAALSAGQNLQFSILLFIGPTSTQLARTDFPLTGWSSYTVR